MARVSPNDTPPITHLPATMPQGTYTGWYLRLPPAALILEGAPASLVDLTRRRYPFFPLRLLMRSSFDSIRRIGAIPTPILFIHASRDEVIPVAEGKRLFEAARGAKAFVEVGGGHMDAIERDPHPFEEAIRAFFQRNHVIMPPAPGAPLAGESGGAILAAQSESAIP